MGWAARLNAGTADSRRARMRRLRQLCRDILRETVLALLPKMKASDRDIVLKILNEEQPEIRHAS